MATTMTMTLDKRGPKIRGMFAAIAPWYDTLNHVLSLNIDRSWRNHVTRLVPPSGSGPILDVCTGTGDLALAYHRHTRGRVDIIGSDFCRPMLSLAERKSRDTAIRYVEADAQQLPFADGRFQIVTVAFGLRNVADLERGLAEMVRVTKPGGRVAVLEFSKPRHWLLGPLYRWYFTAVLPFVGQLLSRSPDSAYHYLPASVLQFPDYESLAERMSAHGLTGVKFYPLTFGIATLYVGTKP